MPKLSSIVLIALALVATSVPSLFASSASHAMSFMNSPISPLHPNPGSGDDDHGDNDEGGGNDGLDPIDWHGPVDSSVVWMPQADSTQMWLKTHQVGVGWWDADGKLHVELQSNGLVKIPASATMISIPRDAAGVLAPPGWKKMMRPENGEWVIVRIAD